MKFSNIALFSVFLFLSSQLFCMDNDEKQYSFHEDEPGSPISQEILNCLVNEIIEMMDRSSKELQMQFEKIDKSKIADLIIQNFNYEEIMEIKNLIDTPSSKLPKKLYEESFECKELAAKFVSFHLKFRKDSDVHVVRFHDKLDKLNGSN